MKLLLFLFVCTGKSFGDFDFGDSDQTVTLQADQTDERCHSKLFDEAVELLSTHTVERLEKQLLVKENVLKEKEEEVETLKLELEKKQDEMEKSWTLVSYMMKVMSSSQEMIKSKEELVVTQAAKIQEMEKEITKFNQETEDTVRIMNNSYIVIKAQRKTIDELKKIVIEDSKLNATYNELKEGNLLQPNCDVPTYLTLMTDSLNSQQEEISELKAVLQEEEGVKTLLSSIATEMSNFSKVLDTSEENWDVLVQSQRLLQKQSEGLHILRTLASHAVTRSTSLQYEEDDAGQILSAELCQCIPKPPVNQTVTLTLVRDEDSISSQWSSWQYDKCQGIHLSNGTILADCGEGTRERRRLKDINSNKWDEEVEKEQCPMCPQFPDQCFNYNELDSATRNVKNQESSNCRGTWCCDKTGDSRLTPDWKGPGWYRVVGQAGSQLITRRTGVRGSCGTYWGGWLTGGHPSQGEGEVTRTVYFDDGSDDKARMTSTKVINCNNEYFVYYLPDVPLCQVGYCTE